MSRTHTLITCTCMVILLSLSACKSPTVTPGPDCTSEDLGFANSLNPNSVNGYAILDPSSPVNLQWGYFKHTACEPDFFEAFIWTGIEPDTPGITGRVNYDTAQEPGPWNLTWPIPLQPGNTYYWWVHAGIELGPGPDLAGPDAHGYFFIGPICSNQTMQPVDLLSPANNTTYDDLMAPIYLTWDDPTPCLVDGVFQVQVSTDPSFADIDLQVPMLQTTYRLDADEIPFEDCTRYYWRIMTDPDGTQEGPFSETWSFYIQAPGSLCAPETDEAPPIPTSTPQPPSVTAEMNLNCRSGPGTWDTDVDDTLFAGETALVFGRTDDNAWLYIQSLNLEIYCWVWGGGVTFVGDMDTVPITYTGPLPTAPPVVDCSQYTDADSCNADPACEWQARSCVTK